MKALAFILIALCNVAVYAADGVIPNQSYPANEEFTIISGQLGLRHQNQPSVINGYAVLAGNAVHEVWDISNPYSPTWVADMESPYSDGEAESHQVTYAKYNDGTLYMCTISGRGIDIWDMTTTTAPVLLSALVLPGINYGDVSNAIWGLSWQGTHIYIGAPSEGLLVVDAADPTLPQLVKTLTVTQLGGVVPGPLFALGNLLVIVTPKGNAGVATLDISNPENPVLLDAIPNPNGGSSYIGGFYGTTAYLIGPLRPYDVTTNPTNIQPYATTNNLPNAEYVSFDENHLFLGGLRGGTEGIWKYDITDPETLLLEGRIPGRDTRWDDQFSCPVGNILIMSDDQKVDGQYVGSVIGVHDTAPDTSAPELLYVNPPDGAVDQAITSSIGLSFSDWIELTSINSASIQVTPVNGGTAVSGHVGCTYTTITFGPTAPLQPLTTYEIVIPVGALTDLVGNSNTTEYRSTFTTGPSEPVPPVEVVIEPLVPTPVLQGATFVVIDPDLAYFYNWDFGDGQQALGASVSHSYGAVERYPVALEITTLSLPYVILEAEDALLSGGVEAKSNQNGFSGTGFADYPSTISPDTKITWQFTRDSNETLDLDIRYALNGSTDRPLDLIVNGNNYGAVQFAPTGSWSTWQEITILDVDFIEGTNVVELVTVTSVGPNVDYIKYATTDIFEIPVGSYQFTQVIHYPLTANTPTSSTTVAADDDNGMVWSVNPDNDTVTAMETTTFTVAHEVGVGDHPRTLAVAPDDTIWVVNQESFSISIINAFNGLVVDTIDLQYASQPYGIAFSPNGLYAFVTLQDVGKVLKINAITRNIDDTLVIPNDANGIVPKVRGVAVASDSSTIYVSRFVSPEMHGEVYEINSADMTIANTLILSIDPGPDAPDSARGVPNYLGSPSISPDGLVAWVPSKKDNTERGLRRDGLPLNHENTVRSIASQINLTTGLEYLSSRIDFDDQDLAVAVAFSASGDLVFVAFQGNDNVLVFNAYTGVEIAGIPVGTTPQGLALDANGFLFVQNFLSRSVSVYDANYLLDGISTSAYLVGEVSAVATEPLTAEVLEGKQLFYNATSAKLNLDSYMSCAACHIDGGSDGRVWDISNFGEGFRNTIDLRGKSGTGHGRLHWSANFDEVHDFEGQIRALGSGAGLMDDADFNFGTRNQPLGDPKAGISTQLDALAAYVGSLNSFGNSPYTNSDGSLTPQGLSGRKIFAQLNCQSCHTGQQFTDSPQGLMHDVGTLTANSGDRLGMGPLVAIDTPTLRGLWRTAPYLHDGSAATLPDVFSTPYHQAAVSSLSAPELDQLVDYLLQIDDAQTAAPIGGDLNGDSYVDGDDLDQWKADYGQEVDNEIVDGFDFLIWQRNFTGPAQTVLAAASEELPPAMQATGSVAETVTSLPNIDSSFAAPAETVQSTPNPMSIDSASSADSAPAISITATARTTAARPVTDLQFLIITARQRQAFAKVHQGKTRQAQRLLHEIVDELNGMLRDTGETDRKRNGIERSLVSVYTELANIAAKTGDPSEETRLRKLARQMERGSRSK